MVWSLCWQTPSLLEKKEYSSSSFSACEVAGPVGVCKQWMKFFLPRKLPSVDSYNIGTSRENWIVWSAHPNDMFWGSPKVEFVIFMNLFSIQLVQWVRPPQFSNHDPTKKINKLLLLFLLPRCSLLYQTLITLFSLTAHCDWRRSRCPANPRATLGTPTLIGPSWVGVRKSSRWGCEI